MSENSILGSVMLNVSEGTFTMGLTSEDPNVVFGSACKIVNVRILLFSNALEDAKK